jgi:hypothetical protein
MRAEARTGQIKENLTNDSSNTAAQFEFNFRFTNRAHDQAIGNLCDR